MPLSRKRKTTPKAETSDDPRADLVRALSADGTPVPSACGTCGATVATDDPEARQTLSESGRYPWIEKARSWRYHRVCSVAGSGPELLALMLNPEARPIRVTQAHADVFRTLGAPLAYWQTDGARHTDRGRTAWKHVARAELERLRTAVEKRHEELTVPVPHSSGWPCAVCGRSHDLLDAWRDFNGRPACGRCFRMVERSTPRIPGNQYLWRYARDAALAEARHLLPPRADTWPLPLAREMASYRPLGPEEQREPWAYVAELPEIPLSDEERMAARLAELEKLAGVAG